MAVQYNNRLWGRTAMVLPASWPHGVVVTMGNCRGKTKVLDIPLGWGGEGGQWSQMTSALRQNKSCPPVICNVAPAGQMSCQYRVMPGTCNQKIKVPAGL